MGTRTERPTPQRDLRLDEVVVPLDGSDLAASALPPARAVAAATGARLRLVTTRWDHDADEPHAYLRRLTAGVEVPVDVDVVLDRDPVHTILMHARQEDRLVCMATHGRGGLGHAILGSVAEAVLRSARRPMLLVGPRLETRCSALEPSNVLIGVERDDASAAVLAAAATWARALHLSARVVEVTLPSGGDVLFGADADAADHVERVADELRGLGVDARGSVVHGVDPAAHLVDEATTWPATLVVLGTHARAGIGRVALGSVAMKVVHSSPCPVLVVPPEPRPGHRGPLEVIE